MDRSDDTDDRDEPPLPPSAEGEEGNLTPKPVEWAFKKIDPDRLKAYLLEHPDAYQKEIAWEKVDASAFVGTNAQNGLAA